MQAVCLRSRKCSIPPSGTPVARVRASDTPMTAEKKELTNWHSLSFYGKLADVAQALKKGDNVYVDGRIEQRQIIARDGSKPRTVHEIVVSQCHLIAPVRRRNKAAESAIGIDACE